MKKTITLLLIVILCTLFVFYRKDNSNQAQEIKIGFIMPLTGDGAIYGELLKRVSEIAIRQINLQSEIKIVGVFEDGKCSGEAAARSAKKLIEVDKVQVIIGGVCSSESLAILPIAEKAKVAVLSPSSNSMDLSGKSSFFFRIYPTVKEEGRVLAKLASENKIKKVAFLSEEDNFTNGVENSFKTFFLNGDSVVISEKYNASTRDFKTQLIKLKNNEPDALFVNSLNPASAEIIFNQLTVIGWKPRIIVSTPISGNAEILSKYKNVMEDALTNEFTVNLSNPKIAELVSEYKLKYTVDVPYLSFAQTQYDSVFLIKDLVDKVGYDGDKLAKAGRSIKDWEGASGSISIDKMGDRVGGPLPRIIRNGKLESI